MMKIMTILGTRPEIIRLSRIIPLLDALFDFVCLEQNAYCVLSDSGTVQEECCLNKTPNVTLRDVTERPETLEAGSNLIAGCEPTAISRAVRTVLSQGWDWDPPPEYMVKNVSRKVVKLLVGGGV